ncbi:MAG: extracellular solute-binding protein [Cyanobacterium sp. T60_A2020_053]|nr:extracellular solute-binding protein [Cyanobacterium sp. T60_A2020_053]
MINRRSFLMTSSALLLSSLITGCENQADLEIFLLQNSIPIQLISAFKKEFGTQKIINLQPQINLQKIYDFLLKWQGKTSERKDKSRFKIPFINRDSAPDKISDLVTLGNYWLKSAIIEKLINPLETKKLENWANIPPIFQQLVTRNNLGNLDDNSMVWGAPYRWGCTMIVYREDQLNFRPQDWQDLWAEELKGKISLLNQPREIIGLILKKLGYSYNEENINQIKELKTELALLNQQVKFYDSTNYLQPLINGDTSLAVGWSTDILPVLNTQKNLKAIIPKSGTSLWADIWVNPINEATNEGRLTNIYQWINYCWQKNSAKSINLFTDGYSPIQAETKNNTKAETLSLNKLDNCDFIEPLNTESLTVYESLWQEIIS